MRTPISVYGENTEVGTNIKAISFINTGEKVDDETRYTALVRYTKEIKQAGTPSQISHWVATITFVYRSASLTVDDRLITPLGFQVVNYRNDQESIGGGM